MTTGEIKETPLSAEEVRRMNSYWRAANYLSVGQIYLYDNPLLREPLWGENCFCDRDHRSNEPGTLKLLPQVFHCHVQDKAKQRSLIESVQSLYRSGVRVVDLGNALRVRVKANRII